MRIISGIYRGRNLKTPPDFNIRPTSDRLRETLFNILTQHIDEETSFLDLCAGTGAVGIEALSRGSKNIVFVDKSRKSCGLIETNLDLLKIADIETEVICLSAEDFLKKTKSSYDIIYFDPPYDNDYSQVLHHISDSNSLILNNNGILIIEHFHKNPILEFYGELSRWRLIKQGDSCLSFYEKNIK